MTTVGHRHDFGKDWDEVVRDWCLGVPLPLESDKAWEALGVLEQLWPEYLGETLTRGQKGNFVIAHVIDDGLTNKRLEIFILSPDPMSICEDVYRFLDDPGNIVTDKIYEIPEIALIRCSDGNTVIDMSQTIQVDPDPMIMGFAAINQTGNSVIVRFSSIDERLQRMMNDKSPQFSKEEVNLLVIDLSQISYSFKNWPSLVRRRLQLDRNRRFSGVILLHRYFDNPTGAFISACHIEEHPNPYHKLPTNLLNDLAKLNQVSLTSSN